MPDILDQNGLQLKNATEIRTDLSDGMKGIYGADINIAQNSPDGQFIGIMTQEGVDLREQIQFIYNSFNPERAVGKQLDERVAINNIARKGGTYTTINIDITVDRTVSLNGLDGEYNNPNGVGFTVQDNNGNQFILADTVTVTSGTHSLLFRARNIGEVETTIGTIQNQTTIILGVTGVNNPSAPVSVGVNQENDAQLRARRSRSVALASQGYLEGLVGSILNLDGVIAATAYQNRTNVTDSDGIPSHSIWVIVDGGANTEIADIMYQKISYGCGMKGDTIVFLDAPSGGNIEIKFDRPVSQNLYVRFEIKRVNLSHVFDQDFINNYLVENVLYNISQFSETSRLTEAARLAIDGQGGGGVPINMEISDDGSNWVDFLDTPTKDVKWTLDPANITITPVL